MLLEKRLCRCSKVRGHIHLSSVGQRSVHLKEWLPQKTVNALKKAPAATVSCEGKIERVDLCLRPVRFTSGGPFQKA
jgi:hypothetical protein